MKSNSLFIAPFIKGFAIPQYSYYTEVLHKILISYLFAPQAVPQEDGLFSSSGFCAPQAVPQAVEFSFSSAQPLIIEQVPPLKDSAFAVFK